MSMRATSRSELAAYLFPSLVLKSLIRLNWMPARAILDELKESLPLVVRDVSSTTR